MEVDPGSQDFLEKFREGRGEADWTVVGRIAGVLVGLGKEDDVGVLPGSRGVAQEEDGGIEGGQKGDKKWGSFLEEEVGYAVRTRGSVSEVSTFHVYLLGGDWDEEVMSGDVQWNGVRWVEGGRLLGNEGVDMGEVGLIKVRVGRDRVDGGQRISESLGHALTIRDDGVVDQEGV